MTLLIAGGTVLAKAIPVAKPERVGMSSERLARVTETMNSQFVQPGRLSGVITLIARKGRIVHFEAVGQRGLSDDRPLARDALFRIYSMTKPITAVAAMMLYEEGRFQLTDPITRWLPELAGLEVLTEDGEVPLERPITMQHLLTHTAGFSYGFSQSDALDARYREARLFEAQDLDEFVQRVARLPLKFQPGERWHYSIAVDLTGLIVQRISGQRFDRFLKARIFEPLGMEDTFFEVPPEKLDRLLPNQAWDETQERQVPYEKDVAERYLDVSLYYGGGGLISSALDYLRFAEMLRNGGAFNGARLLSPKTIEFMTTNHLPNALRTSGTGEAPTAGTFDPGRGFGLGFGVIADVPASGVIGSRGDFYWGGLAGTVFWVDPVEETITIGMIQQMASPWRLRANLKVLTNQALLESYAD